MPILPVNDLEKFKFLKNPLQNQPKVVRFPCYVILISIALLVDAMIFIVVADWLSFLTFLLAFLFLVPAVITLSVYIIYKAYKALRLSLSRKSKPGGYLSISKKGKHIGDKKQNEIVEVVFIGMVLFYIGVKLVQKLTRYYPFSLLFRDRMYHYNNRHLKSLMSLVENIASNKLKKPFHVKSADLNEYFNTLYGKFQCRIKENTVSDLRKELAQMLKVDSDSIYVDKREDGIVRISVPNDIAKSSANSFGL